MASLTSSDEAITLLIGSSGDAETDAVTEAVAAWSEESGVEAEVKVATRPASGAFAGLRCGRPAGSLLPRTGGARGVRGQRFAQGLRRPAREQGRLLPLARGELHLRGRVLLRPEGLLDLGLVINKGLWDAAGLTDDDIPTTWDELTAVAQTLTKDGVVGLGFGWEWQRIGTFMAQAGGGLVADGEAIANSPENVDALTYIQDRMADGTFAYAQDVGAGWGGEAFGKQLTAMTIEGNWITGAMTNDYPDVEYVVTELPAGPAGKGTLQFTNCLGMAADSGNQEAALDLAEYLTSTEQQLAFSQAFGVMPSIQSAAEQWTSDNPDLAAFLAGADYAQGIPTYDGTADVITDFNSALQGLKTGDPQEILDSVQSNLEAIVN